MSELIFILLSLALIYFLDKASKKFGQRLPILISLMIFSLTLTPIYFFTYTDLTFLGPDGIGYYFGFIVLSFIFGFTQLVSPKGKRPSLGDWLQKLKERKISNQSKANLLPIHTPSVSRRQLSNEHNWTYVGKQRGVPDESHPNLYYDCTRCGERGIDRGSGIETSLGCGERREMRN